MLEIEIRKFHPLSFSSRWGAESSQSLWFSWNLNGVSRIARRTYIKSLALRPLKEQVHPIVSFFFFRKRKLHWRFDATSRALTLLPRYWIHLHYNASIHSEVSVFLWLVAYIFKRHREIVFIILPSAERSPITCNMHRVAHEHLPFFLYFFRSADTVGSAMNWFTRLTPHDCSDKYPSRASVRYVEYGVSRS